MRRRTAPQRGRCKRSREGEENAPEKPLQGSSSSGDEADIDRKSTWTSDDYSSVAAAVTNMQGEFKKGIDSWQRVEQAVESLMKRREMSRDAVESINSSQRNHLTETVRFNVGDEIFTVPLHLILSKEGEKKNYFDVLLENVGQHVSDSGLLPPLLDEDGAIFINRDPSTFRLVLNYLRGYKVINLLSEDQLSMLKADARYYQLSGLMERLGDHAPQNTIQFKPGPGVNPERSRLRVVYGVSIVGHRFLITGCHRIVFQVLNSEYVGIGLVSDSCVSTDQEFHKTSHCCVYYMTGVFYSNFPHHRKEDGLESLEKNDYVSLMVDMNKRVAEYTFKNTTKTLSLGSARKLRFAVTMKMASSVRIVPECEAQHLSLFQRSGGAHPQSHVSRDSPGPDELGAFAPLSQPSGAGAVAPDVPEPLTAPPESQLYQQQLQSALTRPLSVVPPRGVEGTAGGNVVPFYLPPQVRQRQTGGSSVANSASNRENSEMDLVLLRPGADERREGE